MIAAGRHVASLRAQAGWIALALALVVWGLAQMRANLPYQYGFDLYHPWGIRAALETLPAPVNPYADPVRVGTFAWDEAGNSPSLHLKAASAFWKSRGAAARFEPTGTPLYYALFRFMPHDYDLARALLMVVQSLALLAGVYWLARARGWAAPVAACVAALAFAAWDGFAEDVSYGNVTSIQFMAFAGFVALAHAGRIARAGWVERLYLPALAFFVLVKPNTALMAAALAAHYWLVRGSPRFAVALAGAAAAVLAGWALGAAYFGDAGIWADWLRYIGGGSGGTLLYTTRQGNQSIVAMLVQNGGLFAPSVYSALVGLVFAMAVFLALRASGPQPERVRAAALAVVADPWLAASGGVILTFATSPIFWPHYWLLALVPLLRLFRWRGRWDTPTTCAVLAAVLMGSPLLDLIRHYLTSVEMNRFMTFVWLPLVPGFVAEVAQVATSRGTAGPESGRTPSAPRKLP